MNASGEQKTKPTQHSVAALRSIGIQPDALVLPQRPPGLREQQAQDRADVRRRRAGRRERDRRAEHLRHPRRCCTTRASTPTSSTQLGLDRPTTSTGTAGAPLLKAVHEPQARGHHRPGRQVHRPARRLPVGHRGAAGRRLRAPRPRSRSAGCRRDECETPEGAAQQLGRRRRHLRARRIRRARHRGQARRAALRPRERHPGARAVPRPAVHGHRVRPARGRAGRRLLDRVRPRHRVPGDRDDGRAGRRSSPAATWAAPCASASTAADLAEGSIVARAVRRERRSASATATATR